MWYGPGFISTIIWPIYCSCYCVTTFFYSCQVHIYMHVSMKLFVVNDIKCMKLLEFFFFLSSSSNLVNPVSYQMVRFQSENKTNKKIKGRWRKSDVWAPPSFHCWRVKMTVESFCLPESSIWLRFFLGRNTRVGHGCSGRQCIT